jgi:hypothetical protein
VALRYQHYLQLSQLDWSEEATLSAPRAQLRKKNEQTSQGETPDHG